jgi:uncharacterized protein (DUF924 family)
MMISEHATEILEFWFGHPDAVDYGKSRSVWFQKEDNFDQLLRDRFLTLYEQAAAGLLELWKEDAQSCLALIILLDQLPRNLFRNTPRAFATDSQALATAKYAIAQGYDQLLLPVQRWFIYLPFEHSESREEQARSLQLWEQLRDDPESVSAIDFARRHAEVIQRFGRFPHRNQILGRPGTAEELEFLKQPGSSF